MVRRSQALPRCAAHPGPLPITTSGEGSFSEADQFGQNDVLVGRRKSLLVALLVAVCGALLWMGLGSGERASDPAIDPAPDSIGVLRPDDRLSTAPTPTPLLEEPARLPLADAGRDTVEAAALARISGRLLEHDGTPVVGIRVTLLAWRSVSFWPTVLELGRVPPRPLREVDNARTAADGSFVLAGAAPRAFHMLGIDLGGARGTLRVVDVLANAGGTSVLGDLRLEPVVALAGRVVGEDGRPVRRARVRFVTLQEIFLEAGLGHVRGDSLVVPEWDEGTELAFALPSWLAEWEERLPLSTARTDDEGRFRLSVPAGAGSLVIDKRGFQTLRLPEETHVVGTPRDVGDLVLPRGREVAGRVVDAFGLPVGGADVFGGNLHGTDDAESTAVMAPAGKTNAKGEFTIQNVDPTRPVVAAARRSPRSPLSHAEAPAGSATIEVELGALSSARVRLIQEEGGRVPKLDGLRLRLLALALGDAMVALLPSREVDFAWRPVADGLIEISGVEEGEYTLLVETAQRFGGREIGVSGSAEAEEIVLFPRGALELSVADGVTGAPAVGARAWAMSGESAPFLHSTAVTDRAGRAALEVFALGFEQPWIVVEQPGRAPFRTRIELEPSQRLDVTLTAGGALHVRLTGHGATPDAYQFELRPAEGEAQNWIESFDAEGRLAIDTLAPGGYRWTARPRASRQSMRELFSFGASGKVTSGRLTIEEGVETELTIE